jgi:hypothetical protein
LEPENRWWTMIDDPDDLKKETIKWQSLEHHGLIFAPDYESHGIPLLYGPPGQKEQLVLPRPVEELGERGLAFREMGSIMMTCCDVNCVLE